MNGDAFLVGSSVAVCQGVGEKTFQELIVTNNKMEFLEYVKYAILFSLYGYLPVSALQLIYGVVRLDMADAFVSLGMIVASVVIGAALGVMGYPVYLFSRNKFSASEERLGDGG